MTIDAVSSIIAHFGVQLEDPAKPFALLVHLRFREGTQDAVSAAFARARPLSLADKGVLAYHLNQDPKDTSRFVVYERWASLADLEAHLRTPHVTTLREEFDAMIVGTPDFHVLVPAGE